MMSLVQAQQGEPRKADHHLVVCFSLLSFVWLEPSEIMILTRTKFVLRSEAELSHGSSPAGGARKKPNAYALGFFQRCVPQAERDVSIGSEVRFAREVCLRHVIRNTLLHCEWSEQHHYAKHNITWRSQTLLNSKRRRTKRLYFR